MSTADHDYIYSIRARQSGTPEPATQLAGHSIETVVRQTRMRSYYDVQRDETKYMWQYGKFRHTATYPYHHRGEDARRQWEREQTTNAHIALLKMANEDQ